MGIIISGMIFSIVDTESAVRNLLDQEIDIRVSILIIPLILRKPGTYPVPVVLLGIPLEFTISIDFYNLRLVD